MAAPMSGIRILELAGGRAIVIHAMGLRPTFHDLLPSGEDF